MKYLGIILIVMGFILSLRLVKEGKGKTFEERAEDVWMWFSTVGLLLAGLMMALFLE